MKIEITTTPKGVIIYDVSEGSNLVTRDILDTKEQQIRDALISLGWTPPPEQEDQK